MLTYNIWFSDHAMKLRMRAIGDLIAQHAPHIIALQEVTDEHWATLAQHPTLAAYNWSPPSAASYYTILGSLKVWASLDEVRRQPFTRTSMQRDLLSAVVRPAGLPPMLVATTHLESLDCARARAEQIAEATAWLGAGSASELVLCGDTNVATGHLKGRAVVEPVGLPLGWSDAWELVGAGSGCTFDAEANRMVHRLDGWARVHRASLRYDRFWTRLSAYECVAAQMVGTAPLTAVDGGAEAVDGEWWPSDHFGLLLTLAVRSGEGDETTAVREAGASAPPTSTQCGLS